MAGGAGSEPSGGGVVRRLPRAVGYRISFQTQVWWEAHGLWIHINQPNLDSTSDFTEPHFLHLGRINRLWGGCED